VSATILHVEDNASNRKIVRDLLGRRGYRVVEALDGEEALAAAERERPDAILMDVQLPRMSGLEATRQLKAREDLRHIPIVIITSYALSGDDQKAFAAGCDRYLPKPYSPRELLRTVEELLGGAARPGGARD